MCRPSGEAAKEDSSGHNLEAKKVQDLAALCKEPSPQLPAPTNGRMTVLPIFILLCTLFKESFRYIALTDFQRVALETCVSAGRTTPFVPEEFFKVPVQIAQVIYRSDARHKVPPIAECSGNSLRSRKIRESLSLYLPQRVTLGYEGAEFDDDIYAREPCRAGATITIFYKLWTANISKLLVVPRVCAADGAQDDDNRLSRVVR